MANGSTTRGPAKRDLKLDQGKKHDDSHQRVLDEEGRELPAYRDEMDSSEITVNRTVGIHARNVPSWALGIAIIALSVGAVIVAVAKLLGR